MLLSAALEMLDERGDATFSMRELSGRIGYAVTAIYRCYETRGHLLRQLTLRLFEVLSEELDRVTSSDPESELVELGERFVSWAIDHPGRYRLMFEHNDAEAMLVEEERDVLSTVTRRIQQILRREGGTGGDPEARAALIFSSWHGLIALANTNRFGGDLDAAAFYRTHAAPAIAHILAA